MAHFQTAVKSWYNRRALSHPTPTRPSLTLRPGGHATLRWILLLLILAAAAVYPALSENVGALAHDAGTVHLYRSYVFSGATADGVLYPRWVQFLHWGLGSPLFTFNPPLPYLGLDGLYRLGIPQPLGWRLLIAAGFLAAAIGAYLLVLQLTGRRAAALAAGVAYLYAPYMLRNAFERGSLEVFSMFLYPWVLWGLVWVAQRPRAGRLLVASLLWAACIACHVLAPLMLAPFAVLAGIALAWRYRTAMPLLALIAGGLLAAFIWLPIVAERNWVHLEYNFQNSIADPAAFPVPWDELLAGPAIYDVMRDGNLPSRGVGWVHLAVMAVGLPAAFIAWRRQRRGLALLLAATTLASLLLLWMLSGLSDPLWQLLRPVLTPLEFRIRLMGVLALAAAVTTGLVIAVLPERRQAAASVALALLAVLFVLPSLFVGLHHQYGAFDDRLSWGMVRAAEIKSGGSAFTSWNEFMPRWRTAPFDAALLEQLGPDFDPAQSPVLSPPPGLAVTAERVDSSRWDLAIAASQPSSMTLPLLYYPRWQAMLDGEPVALRPAATTGYTVLDVPAGEQELALRYARTPAETAGLALSATTLLALVAWAIIGRGRPAPAAVPFQLPVGSDHEVAPPWWLLGLLAALLVLKVLYVDPQTTWLRCVSTAERVCGAEVTVDIPFAGGHRLRGYAVSSYQVEAGDDLRVSLVWQAESGVASPLHSFVHVRNSQPEQAVNPYTGSEIWAQWDQPSPAGLFTTEFVPGKLYLDELRVPIPADMPPGEYRLEVGWFDPASGEQLEPAPAAVKEPLGILWRSILLPPVTVQ